ncbi:MAG: carbohydrate binding domain/collagen triple helix repeat protein [Caudoviricetes sp.]|nr:MAG: carbohydrate binding domain/collagen triple helix repeat protein [Caudoviricetes sp.]
MPEFTANAAQTVSVGQNVLLTETPIPCTRGYVCHRAGSGIITLRGITNQCRARYRVSADANIAIATGGTAGPISLALAITGEPLASATAIVTPAAVGDLFNVHVDALIDVPKGCCLTIALENTSTQAITTQNVNVIIDRVA